MFRKLLNALRPEHKLQTTDLSALIAEQKQEAERWRTILDRSSELVSSTPFTPKQPQLKGEKIVWQYWEEDITDYSKLPELILP